MPKLSVLWKYRKQTFYYDRKDLPAAFGYFSLLFGMSLSMSSLILMILFTALKIPPYWWYARTSTESIFAYVLLVIASTIVFLLTHGAYIVKRVTTSEEDYAYNISEESQLSRVSLPLSILGLKANFINYDEGISLVDKTTQDESKSVRINFFYYKWYLEMYNLNKPDIDELGFAKSGYNHKEIESLEINPFSKIKFYLVWKACLFLGFKMLNQKHNLDGYGSLVLRGGSLRKLSKGVKLNLNADKMNFLLKNKIPLSQYDLASEIPELWLPKAFNKNNIQIYEMI